jgi:SecD/SecF fusion protein
VFIAGPVLTHWKEREPVYRKRRERIIDELGYVPAYAPVTTGATAGLSDEQAQPARRRKERSTLLSSDEPQELSREEFDELVRDIQDDTGGRARDASVEDVEAAAHASREGNGHRTVTTRTSSTSSSRASKPKRDKPKKPRNRKHGRA